MSLVQYKASEFIDARDMASILEVTKLLRNSVTWKFCFSYNIILSTYATLEIYSDVSPHTINLFEVVTLVISE